MILHVVNFYRIADYSKSKSTFINKEHMVGNRPFDFRLLMGEIRTDPRFYAGGRLYLETS